MKYLYIDTEYSASYQISEYFILQKKHLHKGSLISGEKISCFSSKVFEKSKNAIGLMDFHKTRHIYPIHKLIKLKNRNSSLM